jgi:hypothetical protein
MGLAALLWPRLHDFVLSIIPDRGVSSGAVEGPYEPEAHKSVDYRGHLGDAAPSKNTYKIAPPTIPPIPDHVPRGEILTKHKETIC